MATLSGEDCSLLKCLRRDKEIATNAVTMQTLKQAHIASSMEAIQEVSVRLYS